MPIGVGHLGGADDFGARAVEPVSGFLHLLQLPLVEPNAVARSAEVQQDSVRRGE
ncbi:MAG: hypothetical protein IPN90_02335 [Elusimicrobia bacterium]|nr:hypothetical protein [Elusimicrobiota bacterium]